MIAHGRRESSVAGLVERHARWVPGISVASVSEVNSFAHRKDFVQANAVIDRVEALLKQAPAGDGAARFAARLKPLLPRIQRATARHF